jgi:pimeloyl-ACP methyl ester carboxylesterase
LLYLSSLALSPSTAANRRIWLVSFKLEITPLPIPTNFAPLPDWRGWGLSDRHVGHISFERLADDLDAVIAAAGPLRFTLFGIAGGCAVAIAYAVQWPDRVERFVLYGGYTRGAIARSESREDDEEARTVLSVVELGGGKEDPSFRQLFIAQFIPDATPAQAREFNELMRLSGGSKDAACVLSILYKVDIRPNAARVRCPTLVLHPVHNFRIPFEEGRALTACIPNARLVPLNSRNFLLLEQEEAWIQFVSEIEGFLAAPNATLAADQHFGASRPHASRTGSSGIARSGFR